MVKDNELMTIEYKYYLRHVLLFAATRCILLYVEEKRCGYLGPLALNGWVSWES